MNTVWLLIEQTASELTLSARGSTSDVRLSLKSIPALKELNIYNGRRYHKTGIKMKQKELTKTFMIIFQRCECFRWPC